VIVIYCTGLGAVQTTLEAGDPTPLSPLAQTTDTVTATIGGAQAQVLFSGLVPGFSGLYQVNAIVPGNAPTGDAVPLILTAGGAPGPSVNIAVK
jgi:adhesin/invasin